MQVERAVRGVIQRIVTHRPGCAPNSSSDAPIGETDALIARMPDCGLDAQRRDRSHQFERGSRWVKTVTARRRVQGVDAETTIASFERITEAIRLVAAGSRFIATNPDNVGPTPDGPLPATGSVAALMSRATASIPTTSGSRTR